MAESKKESNFKFLGRLIAADLSDVKTRSSLLEFFSGMLQTVDKLYVSGASKAWIYQHYLLSKLAWPFLVYDFPPLLGDTFATLVTRALKTWLGFNKPGTPEILYLPKKKTWIWYYASHTVSKNFANYQT